MESYTRKMILQNLSNAALSGALTATFMYMLYYQGIRSIAAGFLIGFFIYVGINGYQENIERRLLRKTPLLITLGINTLVLTFIMMVVVVLFVGIFYLKGKFGYYLSHPEVLLSPAYVIGLAFGFALSLIFGSLSMMGTLVGKNVLRNLFIGRYRHPVEEDRIFLFVDLASSTAIAEKIGHLRFLSLLNDFFYDIVEPVTKTRGEIYKYVGDEVIVTWKTKEGLKDANCLRCYQHMNEQLRQKADVYRKRYGLVPAFRAGLHAGTTAIGQIGYAKKEIGFVGDVVNTAARIVGECKTKEQRMLISEALVNQLSIPKGMELREVGYVQLIGKEQGIRLFGMEVMVKGTV